MATYSKETALYDTGAIAGGISDASESASKFLSSDESGIMVYDGANGAQYPSTVDSSTHNVFIGDNEVQIRNGTNPVSEFSGEGLTVYTLDNGVNKEIAHYGSQITIGDEAGYHILLDGQYLYFCQGNDPFATYSTSITLGMGNVVTTIDNEKMDCDNIYFTELRPKGTGLVLEARTNGHFSIKAVS